MNIFKLKQKQTIKIIILYINLNFICLKNKIVAVKVEMKNSIDCGHVEQKINE